MSGVTVRCVPARGDRLWRTDRNGSLQVAAGEAQGCLTHKKHPAPRTVQQDYTWGHMMVLGGGGAFI